MDVDVVQIEKRARLNEWERTVISAFANDMLRWCADDVVQSLHVDSRSMEEHETDELT